MFYLLGCLGALLWLVNASANLIDRLKPKPPSCDVFVSKDQYTAEQGALVHRLARTEQTVVDIRSALQSLTAQDEARAAKIHERINALSQHLTESCNHTCALLSKEIGELRGEIKRL
jgi:predicted metal-dependent RNase